MQAYDFGNGKIKDSLVFMPMLFKLWETLGDIMILEGLASHWVSYMDKPPLLEIVCLTNALQLLHFHWRFDQLASFEMFCCSSKYGTDHGIELQF